MIGENISKLNEISVTIHVPAAHLDNGVGAHYIMLSIYLASEVAMHNLQSYLELVITIYAGHNIMLKQNNFCYL